MSEKCPACGGPLVFDPDIQMLVCDFCSNMVPVGDDERIEQSASQIAKEEEILSKDLDLTEEFMDFSIYECRSCGAELAINDVEVATYCAYCGQPSTVFKRIERRVRPKKIIPFKITKNEAITLIREKFVKSDYAADELKYFTPDLLRGVYVPYGMFSYKISDAQVMSARFASYLGNEKSSSAKTKVYLEEGEAIIRDVPIDASIQFPNASSDRLEPFYGNDLTDFSPAYLSGFYADLRDENFDLLESKARGRAVDIFQDRMNNLDELTEIRVLQSNPEVELVEKIYALLPVWFLVFENEGDKYTIMVNGQTGKVVGAVPTHFTRFLKMFFMTFLICAIAISAVSFYAIVCGYGPAFWFCEIGLSIFWTILGINNLKKMKKSISLAQAKNIRSYVTERQDS